MIFRLYKQVSREEYNQQRGQRFLSRGQREKAYKSFEKALYNQQ
jgi:predicted negative regulator of RcsB-dependent stress response